MNAPSPTLARWLSGPRFDRLPDRAHDQAPPKLSFEFFPPRTDALETQLWACIRKLEPLAPRFVSVTYGAGGSTQARTHATVARMVKETTLTPAAHLTCVGASRGEIDDIARARGLVVYVLLAERIARGRYRATLAELARPPYGAMPPREIVRRYVAALEAHLVAHPADWLWGHRRWKLKKPLYGR